MCFFACSNIVKIATTNASGVCLGPARRVTCGGRPGPSLRKQNEKHISNIFEQIKQPQEEKTKRNTSRAWPNDTTKASLLAGVWFAVAMNWGQTGYSLHDLSCRTGFGALLLDTIGNVALWPFGLKPCVHPAGIHL